MKVSVSVRPLIKFKKKKKKRIVGTQAWIDVGVTLLLRIIHQETSSIMESGIVIVSVGGGFTVAMDGMRGALIDTGITMAVIGMEVMI